MVHGTWYAYTWVNKIKRTVCEEYASNGAILSFEHPVQKSAFTTILAVIFVCALQKFKHNSAN